MFERFLPNPEPTVLDAGPERVNPFHEILDRVGLPFRMPIQGLIDAYGIAEDPAYSSEKSPILPCPFGLEGTIRPFSPQLTAKPYRDLLPLWFSAMTGVAENTTTNLKHARAQFSRFFGPAKIGRTTSNTLGCGWRAGPASLTLTVWPPSLQDWHTENEAHRREPRLATACSVSLQPGFRQEIDDTERMWLAHARSIAQVAGTVPDTLTALWSNWPHGSGREFIREPVSGCVPLLGQIALSRDEDAVIVCARQLFIVPRARIEGLVLQNILPAKGGGGAVLSLGYRGPGENKRQMAVSEVFGQTERLEPLAERLAKILELRLEVLPEQYDC